MKSVRAKRKTPAKILGLIVLLIVLFLGIWRIGGIWRKSVWDGEHQINLIINSQPLTLVSLDSEREKPLSILNIPGNTLIETTHGYGAYRAESICDLGKLEKKQAGKFLAESLQEYLGLPIDGYILLPAIKPATVGDKQFVMAAIFNLLKNKGESNLAAWELIRLWWQIKSVRQDKTTTADLCGNDTCFKEVLVDGSEVLKLNQEKSDKTVSDLFKDSSIRQEDLAISVLNSTQQPGLANLAARLITNIGGRVVQIGERETARQTCLVWADKLKSKSYTVRKLIKVFGCNWSKDGFADQRADVILIVSQDYADKLKKN